MATAKDYLRTRGYKNVDHLTPSEAREVAILEMIDEMGTTYISRKLRKIGIFCPHTEIKKLEEEYLIFLSAI